MARTRRACRTIVAMRTLRMIRTVFLLIIGVPLLGLMAYFGIQQYFSGKGEIVLVAPGDAALRFTLDGGETGSLEPGKHRTLTVPQGRHRVELDTGSATVTRAVKVT